MTRPTTLPRKSQAPDPAAAASRPGGEASGCEAWTNRRASAQALRAAQARQISGRRRLVDPATCDRDYSGDEMEFMNAMQEYKKRSGRMFPTWSEVLEVLYGLGYRKGASSGEPLAG
jgi:hypothetical protein